MKDLEEKEASFLPPLEKGVKEKNLEPKRLIHSIFWRGPFPNRGPSSLLPDVEGSFFFLPLKAGNKRGGGGRIDSVWGHQAESQAS